MYKIKYKNLYFVKEDITSKEVPHKYLDKDGNFKMSRQFIIENKFLKVSTTAYSIHLTDKESESSCFSDLEINGLYRRLPIWIYEFLRDIEIISI